MTIIELAATAGWGLAKHELSIEQLLQELNGPHAETHNSDEQISRFKKLMQQDGVKIGKNGIVFNKKEFEEERKRKRDEETAILAAQATEAQERLDKAQFETIPINTDNRPLADAPAHNTSHSNGTYTRTHKQQHTCNHPDCNNCYFFA